MQQDPTSIHQMRVAIRRLRSALYAVRDLLPEADYESVRLKLRYLLQSLGDARDWEVLTERIAELEDDQETDAPALKVQDAVNARKRRALAGAVSAVGSRKNTQTLLEAMAWFEDLPAARYGRKLTSKAKDAAARLLTALFNRVRRRGRGYDRLSVADRHRLRIACKNLRYNIELFRGLYGQAKVERFLARLKPVQDDLGHLNDVSRARDLLTELARQSPQKAAIKTVVARLESRVDLADKRARRHVAALRNAAPFW